MSEELPHAAPGIWRAARTDSAAAARSLSGSAQASIVRFESVDSTAILRGLARSATGTSSLSTPSA